jgi:ubiquinone/menaquinone biosynthesis C-methylase UbiE
MTSSDTIFAGSIPATYDRYLGPMLFAPYGEALAHRLSALRSGSVLETAAGSGIVTQALAAALPPAVELVATDLNPAMVDFARSRSGLERVTWRQADATALPFADASFDAIVCQFGVMFFPDKVAGYREARRVLKPGGHFIFNVWDSLAHNPATAVVSDAVAALFPADPPGFLARTPHGYSDVAAVRADLAQAGFAAATVETLKLACRTASHRDLATGFCQGSPLRNEIEARVSDGTEAAVEAAVAALTRRFGSGALDTTMQAHIFTVTR